MKKINTLSLFCGCGGSDLGLSGDFKFLDKNYEVLPYNIVLGVDNDKKAADTCRLNFSHKVIVSDIKKVDENDLPKNIDLVIGGFPCQSFSTVNPNKDPFDDRGQLYKEMARMLKLLQPKAFIAENVKGMLTLHGGKIFKRVCSEFSRAGYNINHNVINAADYGVPQKRQRVFIVGIKKELGKKFKFPDPTHAEIESKSFKKWVGIKKIIQGIDISDKKYYFSEKAVNGMKNAKNNMKRGLWQDIEKPSLTITSHLAKVSINSRDPILLVNKEKEIYRRFTPLEAARIQSFPDSFKFAGSESDSYRQIGQAIAPVVMWHIGKALKDQIFKN